MTEVLIPHPADWALLAVLLALALDRFRTVDRLGSWLKRRVFPDWVRAPVLGRWAAWSHHALTTALAGLAGSATHPKRFALGFFHFAILAAIGYIVREVVQWRREAAADHDATRFVGGVAGPALVAALAGWLAMTWLAMT